MTGHLMRPGLYEVPDWRDPHSPVCPDCRGTGIGRRGTWLEPDDTCAKCWGTGLMDCDCPGPCPYYPVGDDDEPECLPPSDPWAERGDQ